MGALAVQSMEKFLFINSPEASKVTNNERLWAQEQNIKLAKLMLDRKRVWRRPRKSSANCMRNARTKMLG